MKIILALMILFVMSTIAVGIKLYAKNEQSSGKLRKLLIANITGFAPLAAMSIMLLVPDLVFAATDGASSSTGLGYIAAAYQQEWQQ